MTISELKNKIIQGDALLELKKLPENSIDTIITDPPYGIGFMGKGWDTFKQENVDKPKNYKLTYKTDWKDGVPIKRKKPEMVTRDSGARRAGSYDFSRRGLLGFQNWMTEIAKEMLRVTKPGGTMLIFGGTRTYHRLACAIEDAGWIIKDCIMWIYGSGFPKATDISKQLDKRAGKKGKIIGLKSDQRYKSRYDPKNTNTNWKCGWGGEMAKYEIEPNTSEAQLWNGWKSHGLKPAYEPILVAMKPNEGSYAENALKWGVAGLNIDGGRIGNEIINTHHFGGKHSFSKGRKYKGYQNHQGRFPANIILDEEAAEMLDGQSGQRPAGAFPPKRGSSAFFGLGDAENRNEFVGQLKDSGGASRFFYVAKASRAERNMGCEGLEEKKVSDGRQKEADNAYQRGKTLRMNTHPTVKPLALMEYLCVLTKTPKGGIVLDPFAGSGTTLMAAKKTGRDFIGIEKEKEYCEIAEARIKAQPTPLL